MTWERPKLLGFAMSVIWGVPRIGAPNVEPNTVGLLLETAI